MVRPLLRGLSCVVRDGSSSNLSSLFPLLIRFYVLLYFSYPLYSFGDRSDPSSLYHSFTIIVSG